jgi:Fe-S cluster biosynthesis and repair protein YggX
MVQTFSNDSHTAAARYGTSCVTSTSQPQELYNNLDLFTKSADSLYVKMVTGTGGLDTSIGPGDEGTLLFDKLSNSATHWSTLQTLMANQWAFVNALDVKTTTVKNCTIFQQDMVIFSDSVCWSFGKWFVWQSIFFSAIGPIMLMMSILMCGSMRCPLDTNVEKKYKDVDYPMGQPVMSQPQENQGYGNPNMNYPSQFK